MLVEAADRGLGHHVRLVGTARPPISATHSAVGVAVDPCLRQQHHLAVVERDQAGRPHQVGLAQAALPHLRRIVGIAEEGPGKVEVSGIARHDLPHRQRVRLLLNDQVRPQRLHHDGRVAGEFAHRVQQARIVQREVRA